MVSCQGVIARPGGGGGQADPRRGGQGVRGRASLWEITTGHSGLGTSGSGDVLSGDDRRAPGPGNAQTRRPPAGAPICMRAAGDRLASRLGGLGYLARELTEELPPLMMELGS